MGFFDVAVLALLQGLTEFLPISSTGHLLAARILFGFSDVEGNAFDAFLHLGTLVAVLVYFRRAWWDMARAFFVSSDDRREQRVLAAHLAVATIPAALAGYVWRDFFETHFRSPEALSFSFFVTALILVITDARRAGGRAFDLTFAGAFFIGLSQILALVPAISRSGVTIAAGRALGLSRYEAATFSFLLSAPIIAAAGFSSLGRLIAHGAFSPALLLVGFSVSFVAGWLAIHFLLKLVQRASFTPFVVYLLLMAGVLLYVR